MAKIPEKMRWIYDLLLTAAILAMATVLCTLLRRIDDGSGYVNLIFVLAVATISRWTEGYFWGIFSAVSGVLFVNYVFTYPYWEFNFTITGYPFTFLAMLTVSMMISAMNTQIKKQERLRIETEKEAVRANLLRAMSHDIRTPLTSIVGNTAAILENEDSFSPEQKRRLLEDVNEDAQWLIRMVENLLSITRMSGGQAKIEKDCEAAEEIVGVSVSKFTKRFPAIKVSIEVPDEVLMVPMDATLIRQVIMNLLENAAIHGGNVTQIRVCLSREGTNACFAISDNGVGIPKEKLTTIFNGGLSGVSHNNFDMKKNMGIGLSVCYTIVKAHGGTMTAENLDSGGACFRFYLPLEEGINSEIEG
jgi:two-component system sensor histidine kinase KdpD